MRLFKHTIVIDRPRDAVFDYFTDLSQASKWRQFVKSMELIGSGPIAAGARIKATFTLGGEETTFFMNVLVCDRPSLWRHHTEEKHFKGYIEYRFDPAGGGTRVTMSCDTTPATLYGWFGLPLVLMKSGSVYRGQLPALKRAVEGG